MIRDTVSCCGTRQKTPSGEKETEIPDLIQKELDQLGGFEALAARIPAREILEQKSRTYHAIADPLRLTILYLLRDQPLCVCVINRFMQLSGSRLSYHLTVLKEGGLIDGEYHGNWIIYSITDAGREYI
jgi:ArsR family transcriptional regulator, arsenate/arsenite/antimonite-responsive transcriptional repressor